MDTKRHARFVVPGHAVTGERTTKSKGAGFEWVHVLEDDCSRLAYAEVCDDERAQTVTAFTERALDWFLDHGIVAERLLTDNAWAYTKNKGLRELLRRRAIRQGRAPTPDDGPRVGTRTHLQLQRRTAAPPCNTGSPTTTSDAATQQSATAHPSPAFGTSWGRTPSRASCVAQVEGLRGCAAVNAVRGILLVLLATILIVAAVRLTSSDPRPASSRPAPLPASSPELLRMTVDTRQVLQKRRLPRNFLGFSTEIPYATRITGTPGSGPNPVADGLYGAIRAAGSGAPVLRVGGSSVEQTWWNPAGRPRPPGIDFDVTGPYLDKLREFRDRNGSPLILALNLVNRDPATATDYARAARRALGPRGVRAYELGNEPDAYPTRPYYRDRSGREVMQRPPGYSFSDFLGEWEARADLLRERSGPLPLAGPSACCAPSFIDGLEQFVEREREGLALATAHQYFGSACSSIRPGTPGYPTREKLLGQADMGRVIAGLGSAVATADAAGKPLVVTETNSFACGGQPGISDTFASALWAPEYLMRAAAVGVNGTAFHTFGRAYSPFDFSFTAGGGWTGDARPLYYGLLAFAQATSNRAAILLDPLAGQRVREGSNAVAFPTLDRHRTLRILVLAKDSRGGGSVHITVPRGAQRASLTRLRAPGLGARRGVTLAGQSVSAGSRTGRLVGRMRVRSVRRREGGYEFGMPAPSAALLELKVGA